MRWIRAIATLACACTLMAFPPLAHAAFNDAADSYPAAQDLGSYGAPIYGSQIPDGTYKVGARTTSRMCILYTNPANADARDSKEQAIISVSGGNITAVFYISKAYTHLYFGTQESAAAATNADGTDASAYIAGDPAEGYVPHMFSISVPALNQPLTISTYSGGDRGWEAGKWYTREVVFTMTAGELQAIIGGGDEAADERTGEAASSADTSERANTASGNGTGSSTGSAVTGASSAGAGAEELQDLPPLPASTATIGRQGVLMNVVNPESLPAATASAQEGTPDEASRPFFTPQVIAALVVILAFAAGLVLRFRLFARSLDRSPGGGGKV